MMKKMLNKGFNPLKCKTSLKMVSSRVKLLRNKKGIQLTQLKTEVAQLLQTGQHQTAMIRVEHVVREEKTITAFELIDLYCQLLVASLPIIDTQKHCPIDLKEAIASIIFAAPRCSDVPELMDIRKHFTTKYGKDFVTAALELRPDSGVNRSLIEKLSIVAPDGTTKVKILTGIAEEHNIKWEPDWFKDCVPEPPAYVPNALEKTTEMHVEPQSSVKSNQYYSSEDKSWFGGRQKWNMEFKDVGAAALAAAESAEMASKAARAAAEIANRHRHNSSRILADHPDEYDGPNSSQQSYSPSKSVHEDKFSSNTGKREEPYEAQKEDEPHFDDDGADEDEYIQSPSRKSPEYSSPDEERSPNKFGILSARHLYMPELSESFKNSHIYSQLDKPISLGDDSDAESDEEVVRGISSIVEQDSISKNPGFGTRSFDGTSLSGGLKNKGLRLPPYSEDTTSGEESVKQTVARRYQPVAGVSRRTRAAGKSHGQTEIRSSYKTFSDKESVTAEEISSPSSAKQKTRTGVQVESWEPKRREENKTTRPSHLSKMSSGKEISSRKDGQ